MERSSHRSQSTKSVIVNADDFGLHPSINRAIARGHLNGILSSASLMPGPDVAPGFDDALSLLPELPGLEVGLHLTLVGAPDLPTDYLSFVRQKVAGRFPLASIEALLRKQLDTLLTRSVDITHIDSHQHLHAMPSIMRIVARVAKEYGVKAVRLPCEKFSFEGVPLSRTASSMILNILSQIGRVELDRAGIAYTDHFDGMAISGHLSTVSLNRIISRLKPGVTEIICHPGASNPELARSFDWGYDWEGELSAITDPSQTKLMRLLSIAAAKFSDIRSS